MTTPPRYGAGASWELRRSGENCDSGFRRCRSVAPSLTLALPDAISPVAFVEMRGFATSDDDTSRAAVARKNSPFLTTDQAAHYLGLSRQTLEKMRWQGRGPRYRKHGRYVRYHIADLEAWSQAHSHNATDERDETPKDLSKDGDSKA